MSLATKRSWKDRQTGERQSQTTWHRCIVFGKLGEFAATLLNGVHVQIEGEIRTREYTQTIGADNKATQPKKRSPKSASRPSPSSTGHNRLGR